MLKFFVFTLFVVSAWSKDPQDFEGQWTGVKVYPQLPILKNCESTTFTLTEKHCKCGKLDAPLFNVKGTEIPVIVVRSEERALSAITKRCHCDGKVRHHMVLRRLTENYVLIYVGDSAFSMTVLLARTPPSASELEDLESSVDDLKDKSGIVICLKDSMSGIRQSSQDAAAQQWETYLKTPPSGNNVKVFNKK